LPQFSELPEETLPPKRVGFSTKFSARLSFSGFPAQHHCRGLSFAFICYRNLQQIFAEQYAQGNGCRVVWPVGLPPAA
jgi:hypothetical protein